MTRDPARLSVVIPNYNGRRLLGPCLDSLRAQTYRSLEVVVVDDASTDDSCDFVRAQYPEVELIARARNCGFSGAVNAGIRASRGAALFLLNNDTTVDPGALAVLAAALQDHPEAAFFASRVVFAATPHLLESAGCEFSPEGDARAIGWNQPVSTPRFAERRYVFGASAGAGLYRRALFDDIGLFDEDFVMIHEDQDLNFRAQLRGHRCLYVPEAVVYHQGSATIGRLGPRRVYYHLRNRLNLIAKNLPSGLLLEFGPRLLSAHARAVSFYALRGEAGPALRAHLDALRQLPTMLRKRRRLQASRRVSDSLLRSHL